MLRWFDREKRELPWRGTKDPYAVWVSEVMLQQTTVQTVRPRFRPFLRRFPTIRALARAPLEDVLAAWSGLGYYARARNLHRAAALVVERHGGRLPDDVDALRALPGVGDYMAQAVASLAFGRPTTPIEANVRRVVSRLSAAPVSPALVGALVSPRRPADSLAALFDLGQTVCRPKNPACPRCPIASACRARAEDRIAEFPSRAIRSPLRPWYRCAAAVFRGGRFLFRRRPAGWLAGMWELPGEEAASLAAARALFRKRFPGAESTPEAVVVQPIAGRRVRVEVYTVGAVSVHVGDRWMTAAEIESGAAPALTKKIVRGISRTPGVRRTIAR